MRIPEIAEELRQHAARLGVPRLADLAAELGRRSPIRIAPHRSTPMTPALQAQIRNYRRANPTITQAEIATHFNVNPGRVSEALRGKRR